MTKLLLNSGGFVIEIIFFMYYVFNIEVKIFVEEKGKTSPGEKFSPIR